MLFGLMMNLVLAGAPIGDTCPGSILTKINVESMEGVNVGEWKPGRVLLPLSRVVVRFESHESLAIIRPEQSGSIDTYRLGDSDRPTFVQCFYGEIRSTNRVRVPTGPMFVVTVQDANICTYDRAIPIFRCKSK